MSWTNALEANITPTYIICKVWMQNLEFHSSFTPKSDTLSQSGSRKYGWSRESKTFQIKIIEKKKNTSMFSSTSSLCFLDRNNNRCTKLAKIPKSLCYHHLGFIDFLSYFNSVLPLLWWQGGCCCRALGKLHHVAFACFRHHWGCALRICRLDLSLFGNNQKCRSASHSTLISFFELLIENLNRHCCGHVVMLMPNLVEVFGYDWHWTFVFGVRVCYWCCWC